METLSHYIKLWFNSTRLYSMSALAIDTCKMKKMYSATVHQNYI